MRSLLCTAALFVAVVLAAPFAEAQVCEGDIFLLTQADVDAFECTEVAGTLVIGTYAYTNYDITDLGGLSELTRADRISFLKNGALTDIDGLEGLTTVGVLYFEKNYGLRDVDGLANLTSIRSLHFVENPWLLNIDGLANVTSIGGVDTGYAISIEENQRLATLSGLNNLEHVNGGVWIDDNVSLTTIDAFEGLDTIGGYVGIYSNDALTDLGGFSNLTSIGALSIAYNNALLNVDGFSNLIHIGGEDDLDGNLYVRNNSALTNLDAFSNLESIERELDVRYNTVLTSCAEGLAELIVTGGVGGPRIIFYQNAPGCNGVCEVTEDYNWCPIDAEDEATPLVTGLAAPFPNPTVGAATLAYSLAEPAEVTLTLFDALGRRVRTLAEGPQPAGAHEVTLEADLPAGTYVVRFEAGGEAWTERVTVVR